MSIFSPFKPNSNLYLLQRFVLTLGSISKETIRHGNNKTFILKHPANIYRVKYPLCKRCYIIHGGCIERSNMAYREDRHRSTLSPI